MYISIKETVFNCGMKNADNFYRQAQNAKHQSYIYIVI